MLSSNKKFYSITEYEGFTRGSLQSGYQSLPEKTFDALEAFILANSSESETDTTELLSLTVKRGRGKVITARNYVGLITMKDNTVIEILPKIAGNDISREETKQIFLEMLKSLGDTSFKDFNVSKLNINRMSIYEIFIKMFLEEVSTFVKQGLKSAYNSVEANEQFFKGKLITSQNIKHNLSHHERFFVKYDDFTINRPENRLIKSTLRFLMNQTADAQNNKVASQLFGFFEGLEYSGNYDADFMRCNIDRGMSHYEKTISWCRVFLKGNSFTAYSGSEVAVALLFPMEKVFESYVTKQLRKYIGSNYKISIHDKRYHLFDYPSRSFALFPDILLEKEGCIIVLDTKWKLLSDNQRYSGISQADMYQMYAYGKKYNATQVVMLYPHTEDVGREISYASDDNVRVGVSFINLRETSRSIVSLLQKISR